MSKKINGIQVLMASKKNYILAVLVLLVLIFGGYKVNMFFNNRPRDIQLTLVESKVIDVDKIYEDEQYVKGTELTWWYFVPGPPRANWLEDKYDIVLPETDFSKDNLLLSIGRQIVSVKSIKDNFLGVSYIPFITFSKVYEDKTLFIYSYQGEPFPPSELGYCSLYLEEEDGLRDLGGYLHSLNTYETGKGGGAL